MTTAPLSSGWVSWVAENALRGASADELVQGVVAGGVDPEGVREAVDDVLGSPILAAARALVARSAAMEQAARLRRVVDPGPVPIRTTLDEDALYREHWTAHRPVVLRGAASAWPAARWTFADLRTRFRWAPVEVLVRWPGWWAAPREVRRMAFGDLVDLALGPASDGMYADGRTDVLDQAGLAPLRAELGLLPGLVGDGHPRAWIGPAGTITPLHHDQSSAWLVQLVGRKRLHLASPLEPALASTAVGLFNTIDPRAPPPEVADVRWHVIELGPGDAILTPVGWWHQVEALEPSVSVSLSGFRWPSSADWFLPGRPR